jgi:hypothetical protein
MSIDGTNDADQDDLEGLDEDEDDQQPLPPPTGWQPTPMHFDRRFARLWLDLIDLMRALDCRVPAPEPLPDHAPAQAAGPSPADPVASSV